MVLSRDGRQAYVTLYGDERLQVVDLQHREVLASIPTGPQPVGVSLAPDGRTLWIGNLGASTIMVIDSQTHRVMHTYQAADGPDGFAFGSYYENLNSQL
jgi:YVTN family beta-propeller protein